MLQSIHSSVYRDSWYLLNKDIGLRNPSSLSGLLFYIVETKPSHKD